MLKIVCMILGHSPRRRVIWHDGRNYRAPCRRCHYPLIRDSGGWRAFDSQRDARVDRAQRPGGPA